MRKFNDGYEIQLREKHERIKLKLEEERQSLDENLKMCGKFVWLELFLKLVFFSLCFVSDFLSGFSNSSFTEVQHS